MNNKLLELKNVGKFYNSNGNMSVGIRGVSLAFDSGEFVLFTGQSGSGKSTLLNVLSGLTTIQEGEIYLNGEDITYYAEEELEEYRRHYVSFIFQNYNLIDSYTVYENIELELIAKGVEVKDRRAIIEDIASKVGLSNKLDCKSIKLSGGEKQRVAIARALVSDAKILACDEITGNLDHDTSIEIIKLLSSLSKDKLVLMVTHDPEEVEKYATRIVSMQDGSIVRDKKLADYTPSNELEFSSYKHVKSDNLRLACKGLFNTPKRSILMSIILTLAVFIIGAITATAFTIKSDLIGTRTLEDILLDKTEILVRNIDREKILDEDDLAYFNSFEYVEEVSNKDLFKHLNVGIKDVEYLNDFYQAREDGLLYESGIIQSIDYLNSKDLEKGRLPQDIYECCICSPDTKGLRNVLGKEIVVTKSNSAISFKLKVVGVYGSSNDTMCFVKNEFLDELYTNFLFQYYNFYMLDRRFDEAYVIVDSNLEANQMLGYNREDWTKGEEPLDWLTNIYYNCLGETRFVENIYLNMIDYTIASKYVANGAVNTNLCFQSLIGGVPSKLLVVSDEIYETLFKCTQYETSIYIQRNKVSKTRINNILSSLSDKGYYAIYNYEVRDYKADVEEVILILLIYVFSLLLTCFIYLISHIALRNIMVSQTKDLLIMKSMGIKNKETNKVILYELLLVSLISILVFSIFLIIVRNMLLGGNSILYSFKAMTFKSIFLTFALILVLITLLGLKFRKDIFKAELAPKNNR